MIEHKGGSGDEGEVEQRPIRSFVRREGRLTPGQRRALQGLWPRFGIGDGAGVLDLDLLFGRSAPRSLEIGFGNGEALVTTAALHPERDYLGVEVYRPGAGHALVRADQLGLDNLRVVMADAVQFIDLRLGPEVLDEVMVFFPDPWPKKRHHKRRLIQPAFVELVHSRLRPGGRLHLATDWQDYAKHMLAVLERAPGLQNLAGAGNYSPRPEARPVTKFEARGQSLGHGVWDLLYRKF